MSSGLVLEMKQFVWQGLILYSPGWPATSYIDQVGLELRGQPFSVSKVLGIKTCKNYAQGRRF